MASSMGGAGDSSRDLSYIKQLANPGAYASSLVDKRENKPDEAIKDLMQIIKYARENKSSQISKDLTPGEINHLERRFIVLSNRPEVIAKSESTPKLQSDLQNCLERIQKAASKAYIAPAAASASGVGAISPRESAALANILGCLNASGFRSEIPQLAKTHPQPFNQAEIAIFRLQPAGYEGSMLIVNDSVTLFFRNPGVKAEGDILPGTLVVFTIDARGGISDINTELNPARRRFLNRADEA